MAWFRCLVRGENFPGQLIDKPGLVGFYVTKFIEAVDPSVAEVAALEELRKESKLTPPQGCAPSKSARIFFKEIEELATDYVPVEQLGFAWYAMDDESD